MAPGEALSILDYIAQTAKMTRKDHDEAKEASHSLAWALKQLEAQKIADAKRKRDQRKKRQAGDDDAESEAPPAAEGAEAGEAQEPAAT